MYYNSEGKWVQEPIEDTDPEGQTDSFWNSPAGKDYQKPGWNSFGGTEAYNIYNDSKYGDDFQKKLYGQMGDIDRRQAPQAGTTTIGPGGKVAASSVGQMSQYGGATFDRTNDRAVRAQQMAMLGRVNAVAAGGTTPGQQQFQANLGRSLAAQQSGAGSGAGRFNVAAGMRGLGTQSAAMKQGAVGDFNMLRAQEMNQAQGLGAQLSGAMRGTDMDAANAAAGYAQQSGLFNMDARAQGALANAGFAQRSGLFNAESAQKQFEMNQEVQMKNLESQLRAAGMNDKAIAERMAMAQQQVNQDRQDQMAYWNMLSGQSQFDSAFNYQKEQDALLRQQQIVAASGQGASSLSSAFGSSGEKKA